MAAYVVKRPVNLPPIHPGELVREEVLPALGLSISEMARRLGISRQQLHRILACTHPITPEMALRLGVYRNSKRTFCHCRRTARRCVPHVSFASLG
jgi:addiction module HigA family antidote